MRSGSELADYLTTYANEMAFGDGEPEAVVDRYHVSEIEWFSDGIRLDRQQLVAHARPARKNVVGCRVDVHQAIVSGDRIAARYTLHAAMRKGGTLATEIYMFGELAPDGRIVRVDQLTRTGES